eukprot:CAMPEP_0118647642 /NCGR_PEP_ID=MMETSP0785-20121206/8721_1 /TAXON_ID=91992 /ORGANISM="Bolidomonas pacifica, Strain CCMP 1866" /LENGTH=1553 /DNA_ID=CAMNT_0006539761 /DNA_START=145 /DNA_END=4803 /DNA_ORIENTATION=+
MSTELLSATDPILPVVRNLTAPPDDTPAIESAPLSLTVSIAPTHNPLNFSDHNAFDHMFVNEMETKAAIEQLLDEGSHFVDMLYTFRSASRAIPMINDQNAPNKAQLNRATFDVLRPEIVKLKAFMEFQDLTIRTFCGNIQHLVSPEARKKVVPEGLYDALIKVVDLLQKLDNLKDMKACLNNDFSRYKRAFGSIRSDLSDGDALSDEIHDLQLFLGNPAHPKQLLFYNLRDNLKRIPDHEEIICEMIEQCVGFLEEENYLVPDEKYRLIRAVPHLMLLADGEADIPKSFNIFKNKLVNVSRLQKLFKRYPYIPEIGDMSIKMTFILARAPHYDASTMDSYWGGGSNDSAVAPHYLLSKQWKSFREDHLSWTSDFANAMNALKANFSFESFDKSSHNADTFGEVANIALAGIKLVRDMTCAVTEQSCWKFAHPMTDEDLSKIGIDVATSCMKPGFEYERAVRYNYSAPELSVLVDTISMIKSMSSLLLKNEAALAPMIRLYVHNELQNLVQNDLVPALHRADKKKRPVMTSLMQIRTLALDILQGKRHDDYRVYKKSNPKADVPARVVGPAPTQLHLMRTMLRSLYDDKSEARASRGFFSKRDLDAEEAKVLESFYRTSLAFPYLLSFSDTLSKVSDIGDLWYREFYLEVSKQMNSKLPQFPIAMSLPWILTEHVINNVTADTPLIEDLAYTMDVYNDAAHRALYSFNNQYLYDEIQAEVNLAFDQLVFSISDETYTYHKDMAATFHLPDSFKNTVEAAMKANVLTKSVRRHFIPTSQRHLQLLGRSIDLNHLVSQHISNKLYLDIELCVKRYEASDLSFICEFQSTLSVIRTTHGYLCDSGLTLDDFDAIVDVVNESVGATSVRGRIAIHTLRTLVTDLFPNYSYNIYTQRYVRSPIIFRPNDRKKPKSATGNLGYGHMCSKAYEAINKNKKGFVGQPHFIAVVEALGKQCLPLLIEECLNNLEERLVDVDSYLRAMKEGLPPSKLPKYMFRTGGCYGFFEAKLKPFLGYEDLKSEVFQNFRECGNTLFFLKDISDLIDLDDSFSFVGASPFVGVDAPKDAFSTAGRGSSNSVYSAEEDMSSTPLNYVLNEFINAGGDSYASQSLSDAHDLYTKDVKGVRSVFKTSLLHVSKTLQAIGLNESWATRPTASGTIEVENPTEFYRLFSALNFLFCMNEQQQGEDEEFNLSDEEEFGHGFALTGVLLIHNLNQRASFEMLDFSYHVLNVQKHELCSIEKPGTMIANVDDEMQMQTDRFVVMANRQRDVHFNLFSMLVANDPTTINVSLTTFHPPSTDKDLKSIPTGALKITSSMRRIEQKVHSLSLDETEPDVPAAPPTRPPPPARTKPPAPPKPLSAPAATPAAAPAPASRPPPPPRPAPAPESVEAKVEPPAVPIKKPPPPPKPAASAAAPAPAPTPAARPPPPPKKPVPPPVPTPAPSPAPAPASAPPPVPASRPPPPPKPIPAEKNEEESAQKPPPINKMNSAAPPPVTASTTESAKPPLPSKRPPPPPKPSASASTVPDTTKDVSKPARAKPPPPPPRKKITNMSGKSAL